MRNRNIREALKKLDLVYEKMLEKDIEMLNVERDAEQLLAGPAVAAKDRAMILALHNCRMGFTALAEYHNHVDLPTADNSSDAEESVDESDDAKALLMMAYASLNLAVTEFKRLDVVEQDFFTTMLLVGACHEIQFSPIQTIDLEPAKALKDGLDLLLATNAGNQTETTLKTLFQYQLANRLVKVYEDKQDADKAAYYRFLAQSYKASASGNIVVTNSRLVGDLGELIAKSSSLLKEIKKSVKSEDSVKNHSLFKNGEKAEIEHKTDAKKGDQYYFRH